VRGATAIRLAIALLLTALLAACASSPHAVEQVSSGSTNDEQFVRSALSLTSEIGVDEKPIAPQVAPPVAIGPSGPFHYLARWQWFVEDEDFAYWRCPEGTCAGGVDLRSLPQMGIAGGPAQGYGWFTYAAPAPICLSGCRHVGLLVASYNTQRIGRGALDGLESRLGVTLAADTAHEVLAEVLTRNGDPTGVTAHKPLLSQSIHLGGREAWKAPQSWYENGADPVWRDLALRVKQADYALMKVEMTTRGSDQYLRVADRWIEDYGFDVRTSEQQKDGLLPHATTIQDTFDRPDENPLGTSSDGDWSWSFSQGSWKVVSNLALPADAGENLARADKDLSTQNHYAQVDWVASTAVSRNGVNVRFAAAADTMYLGWYRSGDQWELWKRITGAYTQLGPDVSTSGEPTATIKVSAFESTIELFRDGVSEGTRTDTAITENLRGGMNSAAVADRASFDNFEAADLAEPAGGDRTRIWYGNVQ